MDKKHVQRQHVMVIVQRIIAVRLEYIVKFQLLVPCHLTDVAFDEILKMIALSRAIFCKLLF